MSSFRRRMMMVVNAKSKRLPAGCTEVEYIECDGSQYIDTGVFLQSNNLKIIGCTKKADNLNSEYDIVSNQDNSNGRFVFGYSQGKMFAYSRSGASAADGNLFSGAININEWQTFEVEYSWSTHTKTFIVNGTKSSAVYNRNISPSNNNVRIFGAASGINANFKGKSKAIKLIADGIDIIDYVPCINANNVAGMYDFVSKTFYPSSSSTPFIAGNPI